MTAMYILDTNHCVYLMNAVTPKGKALTDFEQNTLQFVNTLSETLYISQITVAEMYFGMFNSQRVKENVQAFETFKKSFTVLPLNDAICKLYGQKQAELNRTVGRMSDSDLLIACTAIFHHATLVTNDSGFNRLQPDLKLENWSTGTTP